MDCQARRIEHSDQQCAAFAIGGNGYGSGLAMHGVSLCFFAFCMSIWMCAVTASYRYSRPLRCVVTKGCAVCSVQRVVCSGDLDRQKAEPDEQGRCLLGLESSNRIVRQL